MIIMKLFIQKEKGGKRKVFFDKQSRQRKIIAPYGAVFLLWLGLAAAVWAQKKTILINGAGATFPYILYSKWFNEYSKVDRSSRINYRSIGSGGGIRQMLRGTLDFGASDVPMTAEDLKESRKPVIHIPTTLSAVAVTYNLDLPQPLYLNSTLLAQIFSGRITKWSHSEIKALNPKIDFPDQDIVVVYRADGSGTTAVFTEYLAQTNPGWLDRVGKGKSVNWPAGVGGKGNEGVLALIRKVKGALGYIGMGYALNRRLPVAFIQNQEGNFVQPSSSSVQKAAEVQMSQNGNYLDSIVNAGGGASYPIASFSYLLIHQEMPESKGRIILNFLNWAFNQGQTYSAPLYYVPLPQNVIQKAQKQLKKIRLMPAASASDVQT